MPQFIIDGPDFTLERFPPKIDDQLQAWDSADEYLVQSHGLAPSPLLILNDAFGAIAVGLAASQSDDHDMAASYWINDSFIAHQALAQNLELNGLDNPFTQHKAIEQLPHDLIVAGVILKLPRSLRLLISQLDWLNQHLPQGTPIVIGARQRDMPSTLPKLTEQLLDEIQPSRAKKKSRLLYAKTSGRTSGRSPTLSWFCDEINSELVNHPNTYSAQRLDLGARLLLKHIPNDADTIIDLGCGNGVLSIAALQANPDAHVLAVDESWDGICSTQANLACHFDETQYEMCWNDCLSDQEGGQADLVLCNPPFHQMQALTDHVAWQMFLDAKRALKVGGRLRIVGNRHLNYHIKLTRLFGGYSQVASNAKFVVLEATKKPREH